MATASLIREHEERDYARREWNYAVRNGQGKRGPMLVPTGQSVKVSTPGQVRELHAKRVRADTALEKALRELKPSDRGEAVNGLVAGGMSQSDVARAMGFSRQYVGELVKGAECPF